MKSHPMTTAQFITELQKLDTEGTCTLLLVKFSTKQGIPMCYSSPARLQRANFYKEGSCVLITVDDTPGVKST